MKPIPTPLLVHVTDGGAVYITDNHRFSDATFVHRMDTEDETTATSKAIAERFVHAHNNFHSMREALELVCGVLADIRDDEPLPHGVLEELKYLVVDRALELIEPGFDGGVTSATKILQCFSEFRAALAAAKQEGAE